MSKTDLPSQAAKAIVIILLSNLGPNAFFVSFLILIARYQNFKKRENGAGADVDFYQGRFPPTSQLAHDVVCAYLTLREQLS